MNKFYNDISRTCAEMSILNYITMWHQQFLHFSWVIRKTYVFYIIFVEVSPHFCVKTSFEMCSSWYERKNKLKNGSCWLAFLVLFYMMTHLPFSAQGLFFLSGAWIRGSFFSFSSTYSLMLKYKKVKHNV